MKGVNKYLQLHVIVFLWGLTPILGKLISLQALDLVWYRLVLSTLSLFLFIRFKGIAFRISLRQFGELLVLGAIVGVHWFTFYQAIKVSNVAAAMAGFASITFFASILQPVILKKQFFWGDLLYGILIGVGILVIVNEGSFYLNGILYAVVSAFTGALFSVYNGRLITTHQPVVITLVEFAGALLLISLVLLIGQSPLPIPGASDIFWLIILGILCTTVAFTWSISILRQFTPLTIIITNNLEPVYGIVFSAVLFGQSEYMSATFYIGTAIILLSVFSYPLLRSKFANSGSS